MFKKALFLFCFIFSEIALGQSQGLSQSQSSYLFNYKSDLKLEVLAIGLSNEFESALGSLAFRFQYIDPEGLSHDHVLSFIPNITNGEAGIKKITQLLIGGYGTAAYIESFEEFVRRNAFIENKRINRFVLNSDKITALKLFNELEKFKKGEVQSENYSFLSTNGATTLYDFLSTLGYFINAQHKSFSIPPIAYIKSYLNPVLLSMISLQTIPSASDRLNEILIKTGTSLEKK